MKGKYDNSEAAGAVISIVAVFLLSSALFVIIGYGIDRVVAAMIHMQFMPSSQLRYNILTIFLTTFRFEPILILVGTGLNAWVASIRTVSGEIDLSSMMLAASELILITIALIAITVFGGLGLESVINIVNTNPMLNGSLLPASIVPEILPLYQAVQFLPNVVYGLAFLGLVGAIIQWFLTCVQVSDYSQSM